ncbi:Aminotran-5 domain-containing protein [Mycena venus]|uniref:Aminotran-5 domain-containing protein n=1 Tax=Mycena venus TaxID=2733690 RepID=A0A8H7CN52_9AGAR|nr:Aminotran-5 domain-containing protein [Mycena venus]
MAHTLDVEYARSQFPALKSGFIFADNAGGSQITQTSIDLIVDYLTNTNVQLGADYSVSVSSTQRVMGAAEEARKLFGAEDKDEIVFGPSSTANLENLARGLEGDIKEGDEFIITGEHEANCGVWKKLAARRGAVIKYWHSSPTNPNNPYSLALKVEELLPLITSKTRIVAFTATSNLLGSVVPVQEVTKALRAEAAKKGAGKVEVSIDCVAYAPHRRMDVKAWDVDFCVFSFYKVYAPHISALYVRAPALASSVTSIVHHFLRAEHAYKLQPGGPGYETVYATTSVIPYLLSLTPAHDLSATFAAIAAHETTLVTALLSYLTAPEQAARGIRVVGEEKPGPNRVPTISFVVVGDRPMRSRDVVKVFDERGGIGIRYGHFYAYTLSNQLPPPVDGEEGVVRVSLVHYNTLEEVEKIIAPHLPPALYLHDTHYALRWLEPESTAHTFAMTTDQRHLRDWRRRRSPFVLFLHSYRLLFGAALFSLGTAIFVAIHLGFFSTLLIYIPLVVICVPALTVFDAADYRNMRAWPKREARTVWALCRLVCVFATCADIPELWALLGNGTATYFIAANLYEYGAHLPVWTSQLSRLIRHLGADNVFVSIYESNSRDRTKELLRAFEGQLKKAGVRNRVVLDEDGRRREGWVSNGHERVQYMADMRNKALEPLQEGLGGRRIDKIIFFNDVFFDWKSIIRLLDTKGGDFDLACGLDFDGIGLYDTWVIRDSCGQRTKEIWPYFSFDNVAVDSLRREEPVEVATCWNGVAVFDANWFLPPSPAMPPSVPPGNPLKFRADTPCPESECFLISYDMHVRTAPKRPRIYVNPKVNVAYTPHNWLYYGKLKHLSLTRPWRVVWEDWIAHRMFWWVSDRFWLKKDDGKCAFEGDGIVKAAHCSAR